jgi:hypothetical protein
MEILNIFAMVGMVIDDLLAILSVIGSSVLLIGSFSNTPLRRYGKIADWSIMGLVFGGLCQIAMVITGNVPERVGFVFRMESGMVNSLLLISLAMLVLRWWIRRSHVGFSRAIRRKRIGN